MPTSYHVMFIYSNAFSNVAVCFKICLEMKEEIEITIESYFVLQICLQNVHMSHI